MAVETKKTKVDPAPSVRSRFAPIIERAPLPLVEVQGNAHTVSYVNSAFCILVGKTRGELLGIPFAEIVPEGNKCVPILDRVYQTGEAVTHVREDKSEPDPAYWLYAMWPALDANERPAGVIIQLAKTSNYQQNATAINEALLLSSLRQHEMTEAAQKLNAQLKREINERRQAEEALRQSEQRVTRVLESVTDLFAVLDADWRLSYMNAAFRRAVLANGVAPQAMMGKHFLNDIFPETRGTPVEHQFRSAMRERVSGEFEYYYSPWQRWYAIRVYPIEEGGLAVHLQNITKRKRGEQRVTFLATLSLRLAGAVAEADIVRIAVEAVGTHINAARCFFVECLERDNLIVVGHNWLRDQSPSLEGNHSLLDLGGIDRWRQYSGGDFAVEDVDTHPLTCEKSADYAAIAVRSYAFQPFRRQGEWTVVLGVTDTSPRKWTADELNLMDDVAARVWPLVERARMDWAMEQHAQTLEFHVLERTSKLQETITELEAFSYSISHDLRAPLRAMQSFAAILGEDCGKELGVEGKEYIRRIVTAGQRMDQLIQDVLVYSRVARVEMPLERIELASFIAGILESYPQFDPAHARIEVIVPLAPVRANAAALTQCVSNLITNAIKFVAPGLKPHIRIWTEVGPDSRVRLFFRDNGIGIEKKAQEKIFGIFNQIDPNLGGTGIGLAVVRKAAERLGGRISVESEVGKGSTFQLELNSARGI